MQTQTVSGLETVDSNKLFPMLAAERTILQLYTHMYLIVATALAEYKHIYVIIITM